jgi:hypothetical protein
MTGSRAFRLQQDLPDEADVAVRVMPDGAGAAAGP